MLSALDIAKWIIKFCEQHGDPITNLKLQKLLYYAQAWNLALHDEPVFDETIEAWVYGPVVPQVYRAFKSFGAEPLLIETEEPELPDAVVDHLKEVMEVFGGYSSYQLEIMTHRESPWLRARGDLAPDEPCTATILHDDMKEYYRKLESQD